MIFMVAFIVLCVLSIRDARAISKLRQRVRALELREKSRLCIFCANKKKCPDAILTEARLCLRYSDFCICEACAKKNDCEDFCEDGLVSCSGYVGKVTQSPAAAPLAGDD